MKKLIIANWKMHGSIDKVLQFTNSLAQDNIVLALPSLFLATAAKTAKNITIAAQDVSQYSDFGAYTGEISAHMLQEIGVKRVIVGHSERRINFNETNEILLKKLKNCYDLGIKPIFCVGEMLETREANNYIDFLLSQLSILKELDFSDIIVSYEPVWAVGTGHTPKTTQIEKIAKLIQAFMQNNLPHAKITTLYGGSISSKNIAEILSLDSIHGVLIGGASLKLDEFTNICEIANNI